MAKRTKRATIANGTSESSAIEIDRYTTLSIQLPSAWTAAAITFLGSNDGSTYGPVYDDAGTEATIAQANVVADRVLGLKALKDVLAGIRFLKIRSGVAGAAVNQGAERILVVGMSD